MAKYLKPQTPLQHQNGDYIYPITSVDQIITGNGERLNANLISINLNELAGSNKPSLKPQNPMTKGSDYFYPLTTADQVIMDGGYRLNDIVGKVKKSTITLYANGWSAEAPYYYSVTVDGLSDKVNMKMLPHYPDAFEDKQAMKEETAKISFASRNGNILTFECWEEVPTIDIPVDIEIDITYPSKGLEVELNYSVVGGTTEPEEPNENMIWINTDVEITNHIISKNEPSNPIEGMVWIGISDNSNVAFHTMKIGDTYINKVYPLNASQYVNGVWVNKTAKSWQNNMWVDWVIKLYLYKAGDECTDITGGYTSIKLDTINGYAPAITKNATNMYMVQNHNYGYGIVHITNKIDITRYRELVFDGKVYSSQRAEQCRVAVWSDIGTYAQDIVAELQADGVDGVRTLDISKLSGSHVIGFYLHGADSSVTMKNLYLQ